MAYSKDYFELQLDFAKKVSLITGVGLPEALLEYTSFYKTFRIEGWEFNPNNPTWKQFIEEFKNSREDLVTIYSFYLRQIKLKGEKNKKKLFGCFSYEYEENKRAISIHFRNIDDPKPGALSKDRMETRKRELKEMFRDIKKNYPDTREVWGFSWLYNIEAYKRLFPPEYMQNYRTVTSWFKSTALWGQFLDSSGELKNDLVSNFKKCVKSKDRVEDLKNCFPLKLLEPWADVKYFYKFFEIVK